MARDTRVTLTGSDGNRFLWLAHRSSHLWVYDGSARKSLAGWIFTDHNGYGRFGGTNWQECVASIRATAEGYALTPRIS